MTVSTCKWTKSVTTFKLFKKKKSNIHRELHRFPLKNRILILTAISIWSYQVKVFHLNLINMIVLIKKINLRRRPSHIVVGREFIIVFRNLLLRLRNLNLKAVLRRSSRFNLMMLKIKVISLCLFNPIRQISHRNLDWKLVSSN